MLDVRAITTLPTPNTMNRLALVSLALLTAAAESREPRERKVLAELPNRPITVDYQGRSREVVAPEGTRYTDHLIVKGGKVVIAVSASTTEPRRLPELKVIDVGRYFTELAYRPRTVPIKLEIDRFLVTNLCSVSDDGGRLLLILHHESDRTPERIRYKSFPYLVDLSAGTMTQIKP